MLCDVGLHEQDAALGVEARCDEPGGDIECGHAENGRILRNGECVEVDHAEDRVVLVEAGDPIDDRSEQIAQVEIAGWLDAGEDACHGGHVSGRRGE